MILNKSIRARGIYLIGEGGEQAGVISRNEALNQATDINSDLALIPPNARPPMAHIMDYGKCRFEQQKKLKESRKKSRAVSAKEIRLGPTTKSDDFDTKLNHVRKFLSKEGTKVRVSIRFRGRVITHTGLGLKILEKMADTTRDIASITTKSEMESRSMFLVLAPKSEKDRK